MDVFAELEKRAKAADVSYPFKLAGSVLQANKDWQEYPAYVFCLCLSYFGSNERKGEREFPRRWFEHLSRDAAVNYLGGEGVRFGFPRLPSELPIRFSDAVTSVCRRLNEGEGFKGGGLSDRKDDALDIIVWKHFPDNLAGKIVLFGNCASERGWEYSKKTELNPVAFWNDWIIDPPRSAFISSLFIPHRVEYNRFLSHLRKSGIIFDRCRISYWAHFAGPVTKQIRERRFFDYSHLAKWCNTSLARAKKT